MGDLGGAFQAAARGQCPRFRWGKLVPSVPDGASDRRRANLSEGNGDGSATGAALDFNPVGIDPKDRPLHVLRAPACIVELKGDLLAFFPLGKSQGGFLEESRPLT